jgi:hypothetical protein
MKIKRFVFDVNTRDYTEPLPVKRKWDIKFIPKEVEIEANDPEKSRREPG